MKIARHRIDAAQTGLVFTRAIVVGGVHVVVACSDVRASTDDFARAVHQPHPSERNADVGIVRGHAHVEHLEIHLARQFAVGGELPHQNAQVVARHDVLRGIVDHVKGTARLVVQHDIPTSFKVAQPPRLRISNGGRCLVVGACWTVQPHGQPAVVFQLGQDLKRQGRNVVSEGAPKRMLVKRGAGGDEQRRV